MTAPHWRLIPSSFIPDEGQMEYDRKLFKSFQDNDPPILRFFYFSQSTLTLGRLEAKRFNPENFPYPSEVRPTGGRAVLHGDQDLCYTIIASSRDSRVGGDLMSSYSKISRILARSLQQLGRSVQFSEQKHPAQGQPHCFSAPSKCELLFEGKKVAGGAQAREGNHFLQQGVILLSVSPEWKKAFPEGAGDAMAGLNDNPNLVPITRWELEKTLMESFELEKV